MYVKSVMQNPPKSKLWSTAVFVSRASAMCLFLTVVGCDGFWSFGNGSERGLQKFASANAFKSYLAEQVESEGSWWRDVVDVGAPMMAPQPGPAPLTDPAAGAPADSEAAQAVPDVGQGAGNFSTTNIQEAGVDESDVVKNDGTYLYILDSDELKIVRAVPADDMAIVSTITLPGRTEELYLRNDTIVAIGSQRVYDSRQGQFPLLTRTNRRGSDTVTVVTIVDVNDRSAPTVVATIEAEASLNTSRLIGSKLHIVLSVWPNLPDISEIEPLPFANPIVTARVSDLIPDITVVITDGESMTRDLLKWENLYYPVEPNGYEATTVVTIDVDSPADPVNSVGVLAEADITYVSSRALYVTNTEFDYEQQDRETTDIHKFDFRKSGAAYAGSGSIPGRLLNRFSVGEYKGYLRAATTVGHVSRSGSNGASNNIYVLAEERGELVIVGGLEGIAPGERIYSARFIGDRGFLVTFKKVDPLFTFDLSKPTDPRVVGELKVPGYSDYIHPLGDNHLLTIGKDALDVGDFAWYQGVQVSIFDVTDFANPWRVDVEIVGDRGTESEALRNPHAFNYSASRDILAVPMTISEVPDGQDYGPSAYGDPVFDGLCLYRVTAEEGIEPIARIATTSQDDGYLTWSAWTRGIFIGDYVYAVTDSAVQAAHLDDLTVTPYRLPLK